MTKLTVAPVLGLLSNHLFVSLFITLSCCNSASNHHPTIVSSIEETWVNSGSIEYSHTDSDDATTAPMEPSITKTYSTCSRFDAWKNFCSLVRFAAGEWKIHLTMTDHQLAPFTMTPFRQVRKSSIQESFYKIIIIYIYMIYCKVTTHPTTRTNI